MQAHAYKNVALEKSLFTLHQAKTQQDLDAIYRFRYEVYVEQMQRNQQYADHINRRIEEPLDEVAINLYACSNDRVAGVVRLSYWANSNLDKYVELYQLNTFNHFADWVSITTKLMIAEQFKGTRLGLMICMKTYETGCTKDTRFNFIDCNAHLVGYFLKLGYRFYMDDIMHPEYGSVTPMVLVNQDLAYLKHIRSPFYSIGKQHKVNDAPTHFFNTHFANYHKERLTKFKSLSI